MATVRTLIVQVGRKVSRNFSSAELSTMVTLDVDVTDDFEATRREWTQRLQQAVDEDIADPDPQLRLPGDAPITSEFDGCEPPYGGRRR